MNDRSPIKLARLATILWTISFVIIVALAVHKLLTRGSSDFDIFYIAANAVVAGDDIYNGNPGYLYPPTPAIAMAPLAWLPLKAASVVWAGLLAVMTGLAFWFGGRGVMRQLGGRIDAATLPVMGLISLALIFRPLRATLNLAQTDVPVVLATTVGMLAYSSGRWQRGLGAGLALGGVATIKYLTLGLIPLLMLRARVSMAVMIVAGFVLLLLSGSLIFGWAQNLEYIGVAFSGVAGLMGIDVAADGRGDPAPLTFIRSVSIPSVVARAFYGGDDHAAIPSWLAPATSGAAGALCLATGWIMYAAHGFRLWLGPRWADSPRATAAVKMLEWTGVLVAVLALSPQTTTRHTVLLLPLMLVASQLLVLPFSPPRRLLVAAMGAAVSVGTPREIGGPMVGVLGFYFSVLWLGLGWARWVNTSNVPLDLTDKAGEHASATPGGR